MQSVQRNHEGEWPMRGIWLVFILLIVGAFGARADSPAIEAFDRGNYEQALALWMPDAHAGDPEAQIGMGMLWQEGLTRETPKDWTQAMSWYLLAARQGATEAMVALGVLQLHSGSTTSALQWLSLAAQRGNPGARSLLAQMGQPVQDIEGMLAAQSQASSRALNDGVADLGYALGCAIGGGCGDSRPREERGFDIQLRRQAQSPLSCNQIGSSVSCSDGTSYNRIGDTVFGSDGTTYNQIGGTTFGSDGTNYNRIGDSIFGSDGTSYTRIGNTVFGSDGTSCTQIGNSLLCD
jgi:TPR repeat protein